ncbi:MAG TPA: hypothetical protein VFF76_02365 [Holophagaceae bacterium]|jgi:hypothetical protein|nr:hypothetical protein [Holophagaceae bacterium]
MKRALLMILVTGSLFAQSYEIDLGLSHQAYQEPATSKFDPTFKIDSKTIPQVRIGVSIHDTAFFRLQLVGAIQPRSETTVHVSELGYPSADATLRQGYWGIGAAITSKTPIEVGGGVEYRSETLDISPNGLYPTSGPTKATYGRPWARLALSHSFSTAAGTPFIGLEWAMPLKKQDYGSGSSNEDLLKALAAKSQVGICGGIRF